MATRPRGFALVLVPVYFIKHSVSLLHTTVACMYTIMTVWNSIPSECWNMKMLDVSLLLEHLPVHVLFSFKEIGVFIAVQQGTTFFSHFKKHGKYYYKHLLRFNYRTGGNFVQFKLILKFRGTRVIIFVSSATHEKHLEIFYPYRMCLKKFHTTHSHTSIITHQ